MAYEIERKFLVTQDIYEVVSNLQGVVISQGYLNTDPTKTVRIRRKGNRGFITVKGLQVGVTKPEYEYEIPLQDAQEMLMMCDVKVEKIRYEIQTDNELVWEIDVFTGNNEGLVIVEIELPDEEAYFKSPSWLGKDVSMDLRFANSVLAQKPFNTWLDNEKNEIITTKF